MLGVATARETGDVGSMTRPSIESQMTKTTLGFVVAGIVGWAYERRSREAKKRFMMNELGRVVSRYSRLTCS